MSTVMVSCLIHRAPTQRKVTMRRIFLTVERDYITLPLPPSMR